MLGPGQYYYNSPIRLTMCYENSAGTLVDPDTVTFKLISPHGTEYSYVYLTDSEVTRDSTGIYNADFTPDETGRWFYRWESTGTGLSIATEGEFLIQYSPFDEGRRDAYRRNYWGY